MIAPPLVDYRPSTEKPTGGLAERHLHRAEGCGPVSRDATELSPLDELAVAAAGVVPLTGGVVAHNEEGHIERSVRSLLDQRLPPWATWERIWVVASGCTDRTVEIARRLARDDPRVSVVVESERRGKASAIREVIRRAKGEHLVLLNADAVADSDAVAHMLRAGEGRTRPFAVMARPVVPAAAVGPFSDTLRWMWDLHHEYHTALLADGRGAHVCDELLLLSGPAFPEIPTGVINDGSYLAVWLSRHQGSCWYSPEARVEIEVPRTARDHLRQRRRIHVGNGQVAGLLGAAPTTLPRYFGNHPIAAARTVGRSVAQPKGLRHFLRIATGELIAHSLALWDRITRGTDHVRWRPIEGPIATAGALPPGGAGWASSPPSTDRRVAGFLDIARQFETTLPVQALFSLLPEGSPGDPGDLAQWLEGRPHLGTVDTGFVRPIGSKSGADLERRRRGEAYRQEATRLFEGPLAPLRRWLRCVTVTGSAAYGEPEEGDDLDFFIVVRRGALWCFLLATYAALRVSSDRAKGSARPVPCFNYVVDDLRSPRDLQQGQGLLFAREALSAVPVWGDEYYRGLLARATWMASELPRLYAARTTSPGPTDPLPAPWLIRAANAVVFPFLATYLQLAGLRRNAKLRESGRGRETFRTTARPHRLTFASRRFEELRARYDSFDAVVVPSEGVAGPSGIVAAR